MRRQRAGYDPVRYYRGILRFASARVRPGALLPGHTPLSPRPGYDPVRYYRGILRYRLGPGTTRCVTTGAYSASRRPGYDPVRYYRGILRFASAPGPRKSPLDAVLPVTRVQLSSVMSRFSSTGERIRRPCGEFELSRRRQPERNRIRRTIPHRHVAGRGPAAKRWPTAKRPESPPPVSHHSGDESSRNKQRSSSSDKATAASAKPIVKS